MDPLNMKERLPFSEAAVISRCVQLRAEVAFIAANSKFSELRTPPLDDLINAAGQVQAHCSKRTRTSGPFPSLQQYVAESPAVASFANSSRPQAPQSPPPQSSPPQASPPQAGSIDAPPTKRTRVGELVLEEENHRMWAAGLLLSLSPSSECSGRSAAPANSAASAGIAAPAAPSVSRPRQSPKLNDLLSTPDWVRAASSSLAPAALVASGWTMRSESRSS